MRALLRSRNGLFIERKKVTSALLRNGDCVQIGPYIPIILFWLRLSYHPVLLQFLISRLICRLDRDRRQIH